MKKNTPISIFWFRRDLRLDDNRGLYEALLGEHRVLPIFIFDSEILEKLPHNDHRVSYIHHHVSLINNALKKNSSGISVYHGKPQEIFQQLLGQYDIQSVYTNHDYEPYATDRDQKIHKLLVSQDVEFHAFKDQVIFEKDEVVKDDGTPYVVYTPYMKRWRVRFNPAQDLVGYSTNFKNLYQSVDLPFLSLKELGFETSSIPLPVTDTALELIHNYGEQRDFPAVSGTSRVGTDLRFGTVSIRSLMKQTIQSDNDTFMKELIWREFFMQILWHFPHTAHQAFREKYDTVPWRDAAEDLQKWKDGQTGYPMVDAGMRELNATGYMHNRVRMVVASFLCKHLLIDWREGERYFAEKLFDYEQSSNVGNWQWAAGSGVDAAPYFRVFNPETQFKKFDKDGEYVRKWVPEYFGIGYVTPMVEHKFARERAIETYKTALDSFGK